MIYIYGAGNFGKVVGSLLKEARAEFRFVDKFSPTKELIGVPVLRPETLKIEPQDIVYNTVAAFPLKKSSQVELEDQIRSYGFKKVLGLAEIGKEFPTAFRSLASDGQFWRSFGDSLKPIWNTERAREFRAYLNDSRSLQLFDQIEAFRLEPTFRNYIWPDIGQQYTETDIIGFPSKESLSVVDLGSFDGCTLEDFVHRYGKRIRHYLCFEPDQTNIEKIRTRIERIKTENERTNFEIFPFAVGKEESVVGFSSDGGSTGHIDKLGERKVRCVNLDSLLDGRVVNYIKFDIEGGESDALTGASKLIQKQRPDLAVSLYHRPEDFWELPLKIKGLLPNAKMDIRQHHHWGLELCLYVYH